MRKYIIYLIPLLLLSFSGCNREIVSGLDGSVDERVNNTMNYYNDQLTSAENGWLVSVGTRDGFYQFWMEFHKNGTVTMYTDNLKYVNQFATTPKTSTYSIQALQRPTIVFDTYSYLAIINDPDDNISGGSNKKGLVTDFEFEFVSYDEEAGVFRMTGVINRVDVVFRKASAASKAGVENGDLMSRISEIGTTMASQFIKSTSDNVDIVMKISSERSLYAFWFDNQIDKGEQKATSYSVEVDGSGDLFFPSPIVTTKFEVTGMKYDTDVNSYTHFYTTAGLRPVTVDAFPPELELTKIYSWKGGKMFNSFSNSGVKSPHGPTATIVENMGTGFIFGGLIMMTSLTYRFVDHQTLGTCLKIDIITSDALGSLFGVVTYPATYLFKINYLDDEGMKFEVADELPTMDKGARVYYETYTGKPTKIFVDSFLGKTFQIQWTSGMSTTGLPVEFRATDDSFVPAATLLEQK